MNTFSYNGMSTADFGLLVNGLSTFGAPSRRVQKFTVPGRDGDIIIDDGTYDNYIARYEVAVIDNFKFNAREVANWLLSAKGYSALEDTYNPTTYRLATCYTSIEYFVTNLMEAGNATIEFDCKPQRYYANVPLIDATDGMNVENPTWQTARPIIIVQGTGTFYVNDYEVTVLNNSGSLYINSETMQCYEGETNKGNDVELDEFPVLVPGDNEITFDPTITSLVIEPRWWEL